MIIEAEIFEKGSGNVFADLGFPNPEEHQLKARLVSRISDVMKEQGTTQTAVGKMAGISQPEVSRLLKGHFQDVSVEKLMRILTRLGCEVSIVVRPQGKAGSVATFPFVETAVHQG